MKGLVVDEPWVSYIVDKRNKDWELRTRATHKRERIALIRKGSGLIVGTAEIVGCTKCNLTFLARHKRRHQCAKAELVKYARGRDFLYVWALKDVRRLKKPVPYRHPQGAVVFVTLPDDILEGAA